MIGVRVNYRLAPAATWPVGATDVAAALSWVHGNIDLFNGDAREIVAVGYGAGAFHEAAMGVLEFREVRPGAFVGRWSIEPSIGASRVDLRVPPHCFLRLPEMNCGQKGLIGPITITNLGSNMPLLHFGSEEQRRRYLPIIAKGGVVTAIAISEPQAGSDVTAINTRAKRDGDCYVLNGRKQWCSYGVVADFIVVMARTSDSPGADGISAFIVEPKTMPGITFGRHERKMGFRGAPNTPIFFDNVQVPVENLVGEEGKGFRASMRALDLNRPTIGAQSVGLAQGALDACVAYAKERKQFKKSISDFQGIQFMHTDGKHPLHRIDSDLRQRLEAREHGVVDEHRDRRIEFALDAGKQRMSGCLPPPAEPLQQARQPADDTTREHDNEHDDRNTGQKLREPARAKLVLRKGEDQPAENRAERTGDAADQRGHQRIGADEQPQALRRDETGIEHMIKRCTACGDAHYFPRSICPFCYSDKTVWEEASGEGTIYTYSLMRKSPTGPYAIGYVTLKEGPSVQTNFVDCDLEKLRIGQKVKVVFKPTDGAPLPFFTPV